jgi:hypothetical protein
MYLLLLLLFMLLKMLFLLLLLKMISLLLLQLVVVFLLLMVLLRRWRRTDVEHDRGTENLLLLAGRALACECGDFRSKGEFFLEISGQKAEKLWKFMI